MDGGGQGHAAGLHVAPLAPQLHCLVSVAEASALALSDDTYNTMRQNMCIKLTRPANVLSYHEFNSDEVNLFKLEAIKKLITPPVP